jgi:hypothetical protein
MNTKSAESVAPSKAPPTKIPGKSFGKEADAFLSKFYDLYHKTTIDEKIRLLENELGGVSNFYGLGGEVDDTMKLACLEYEFLELKGQISLTLA